ncbi:hypothetical protein BDW68DRAFT_128930 [Aspergillus falconensis]
MSFAWDGPCPSLLSLSCLLADRIMISRIYRLVWCIRQDKINVCKLLYVTHFWSKSFLNTFRGHRRVWFIVIICTAGRSVILAGIYNYYEVFSFSVSCPGQPLVL